MKKNLFVLTLLSISCCSFAQIFQENFDGNGPGISAWTIIDADGLTPTPEVAFITSKWSAVDRKGPNADFGGPAGNFAAASTSWFDPVGTANDWLISPKLSISGTSPYLTWEAKAQDANYFDGYKVMLSTNGGKTIADFDVELMDIPEEVHTASGEPWKRRFISLIPYIGKDIRFAIVNNSDNKFVLLVDDFRVGEFTPPAAPNCPKLISPINESTNISFLPFTKLEWTPDNLGGTPLDYDLYFSDEVTAASLETNTIDTKHDMYWLEGDKTYYWKVIAKNEGGISTNCPVYSFKTEIGPMAPYCGPLDFSFVEPITNVSFSNLNNTSNASYDSPSHEKFTDKIANLNKGETYTISLQGNTGGNFKNRFIVFIDWNKNNVFDTDETYIIPEALENSTGEDGKKISMDITTPTTASKGEIRMRVKKVAGEEALINPCKSEDFFGQAEDYTINISDLSTTEFNKNVIKIYPNPVVDILNIDSPIKLKTFSINDINGKLILSSALQTSQNKINISQLPTGLYILTIETERGKETFKFIKK